MLEKLKGYASYFVLLVIISILFSCISYSSLNKYSKTEVVLDGERLDLQNDLIYVGENIYVSYDDVKEKIAGDIFKESAVKKIIITANNSINVYTLNSNDWYVNYQKYENSDVKKYITAENIDYILLDELCDIYDFTKVESGELNLVNILKNDFETATLKYDREYGYLSKDCKKDKILVGKEAELNIVKDANYYDESIDYVTVVVEKDVSRNVVFMYKQNLNFEYIKEEVVQEDYEFKTIVQNEDNLNIVTNEDNYYIYSVFKLVTNAGELDTIYDINSLGDNSYAMITNGYRASNYDSSMVSYALQNMNSRQKMVQSIAEKVKNTRVKGIVVNFREFKVTSKEYFTQFVKELSMYMHMLGKETMVYIPINSSYIDMESVLQYADNCILIQYGIKSENSKTSGPDSSPTFVENNVKELLNKNVNVKKVIIEIPLYSVLWTEKEQKVVNAQYVYSSAIQSYITQNSVKTVLDEQSGQMYAEHTKGNLTYKMWLEDMYSINKKTNIAKENKLGGVSLYKKGYESQELNI